MQAKALRKANNPGDRKPLLKYAEALESEDAPAEPLDGWQVGKRSDEAFIHLNRRKMRHRKRQVADDYKSMLEIAKQRKLKTQVSPIELDDGDVNYPTLEVEQSLR